MRTDRDWEKWGSSDPYFGVLSADYFRKENLSDQAKKEFFLTGEEHIESVFSTIREVFDPKFAPTSALDFGCGVGRLLIPLASRVSFVVGVDVSASMLLEARKNCEKNQVREYQLVLSDDALSAVPGKFDLVHSSLVLQHIPWYRGKSLIGELLKRVQPLGFVVLQFYYGCNASSVLRALVKLRYSFPVVNFARNLLRRRPLFEPAMQLHVYELPWVMHRLRSEGFTDIHQFLKTEGNGTFESVFVFAMKKSNSET